MCGIIGGISNRPVEVLEASIKLGLSTLGRRGPDGAGSIKLSTQNGDLILGHARLAIIDRSSGGHQPMQTSDGRYSLVFNGEVYNYIELRNELSALGHSFNSESDTQVLLTAWAEWGDSCLMKLVGMFAFVVHDALEQTLTLVRDPFGIKPLFYSNSPTSICFASELNSLLRVLPSTPPVDPESVYSYLVYGNYDDNDRSFFLGCKNVLPGNLVSFSMKDLSVCCVRRWWYPTIVERTRLSFLDASVQLREILLKNIKLNLRSDVPYGAALSGGLDSSVIVSGIRLLEPDRPINTFTYCASGFGYDEEHWANIVNKSVCATSNKIFIREEEFLEDLESLILCQGEPFVGTSLYAQNRIYKCASDLGFKVMLDGQGADELFAGYDGYPQERLHSLFDRRQFRKLVGLFLRLSRGSVRRMTRILSEFLKIGLPRQLIAELRALSHQSRLPDWVEINRFNEMGVPADHMLERTLDCEGLGRRLAEALRDALTRKGLPALLRHADRNSMYWSVESRVPFLTTELAEFTLSLPESYLISSQGETKSILREAMRGIVPPEILARKDKVGFRTPESAWMFPSLARMDRLFVESCSIPFINMDKCRRKLLEIKDNPRKFTPSVWRMVNYILWARSLGLNRQ